ncbi:hypothetical protein RU98_GL001308 [Enterococcus caccae]|nr:hypothetical protein RU98_GL001308 [Enterococcus caccae]
MDEGKPIEISYEESIPYEITSLFLNNKDKVLSQLFNK